MSIDKPTRPPRRRRTYRLKARAERQRQTRDRIVAATVALHEAIGPARTTIAEIARRAGVQRLTVYNAFPEPAHLFAACQKRFLAANPLPDLAPRPGIAPMQGLERTLTTLYAWYRATESMERHVHRERHLLPALDALMAKTGDVRFAAISAAHAAAIAGRTPSRALRALVSLAFEFRTWELLTSHGLRDAEIARLTTRAVQAART